MTRKQDEDREALERLAASIVEDLLNAPDDEIIADLMEDGLNPSSEADVMRSLIENAARQCGKSKFEAAKKALAATKRAQSKTHVQVDASDARIRIAKALHQARETGLSMAARNETELSDNDAVGMLADLEELGIVSALDRSDKKP